MVEEGEAKNMQPMIKEKGFVTLLILLTLAALLGTGTLALTKTSSQQRIIVYEGQKTKAVFLADSGIEWAKERLKDDSSWEGGNIFLETGWIRVEVMPIPEGYRVTSRAESGRAQHNVSCELFEDESGSLIMVKYWELYS